MVRAEYAVQRPTTPTLLRRGLFLRCPQCGSGRLFRFWLLMKDECPRCDLHFERIEGHWIGAIAMNTVLTLLLLLGTLVGGFAAAYPDAPSGGLFWACLAAGGLGPLVFHPFSRTTWLAIDLAMRPVTPDEVS